MNTIHQPPPSIPGTGFRARRVRRAGFALLVIVYLAVPNARPDFSRYGCHDSENYLSLSYNLVHGQGYTRSMAPGAYVPQKWFPPGMAVLMAPAVALSGTPINWLTLKWTVAAVGLAGVQLAWLLTRRWTGDPFRADVAAAALGLNPCYWDFSHQVMAEVPVTVWIIGGLWLVDRVWSGRRVRAHEAVLAGCVCGLGMLIKGYAAGLALAPLAYAWGPRRGAMPARTFLTAWVLFGVGFALPTAGWTARNATIEGHGWDGHVQFKGIRQKSPMDPHGETMTARETVQLAAQNAGTFAIYHIPRQIVPGLWSHAVLDWNGSGWLALALTTVLLALCWPTAPHAVGLNLAGTVVAALNLVFVDGYGERYWIPFTLLATLAIALRVGGWLVGRPEWVRRAVAGFGLLVLAANLGGYMVRHERSPYSPTGPWEELVGLFEAVTRTEVRSDGVLTPNFLTFQMMTGIPAPMTVDQGDLRYDHMVARVDGPTPPQPPPGSHPVLTVHPWCLYRLARPMTIRELLDRESYHGIRVFPYDKSAGP